MKNNKVLLMILIIVLMLLSGVLGFKLSNLTNNKEGKESDTTKTEESEKVDESAIKERIHHIVEIGTYYNIMGYNLASEFYNGISEITREQKLQMTYIGTRKMQKEVMETPEKYKDNADFNFIDKVPEDKRSGLRIIELSIDDFEKEYAYLFNEEIGEYTTFEISGCPHPFMKDDELGKIYLNHNCGGSSDMTFESTITKEDKDENNYYVYTKEGFNGDLKEVVWKFDKNGYFISTTKNEQ